MPKTVKELIRDRYEKLRDHLQELRNIVDNYAPMLPEMMNMIEGNRRELARILEILAAEPQPDAQFFWPANVAKLVQELVFFSETSPVADSLAYNYQEPDMRAACNAFQDYLVGKYDDIELVNLQMARHAYAVGNRSRHADALVILCNPANPSEDLVLDFCWGSSEPGTLFGKLQVLVHPERRPYPWWVDNNFPQDNE